MSSPFLSSLLLFFSFFSSEPILKEVIDFKKEAGQFSKYASPQLTEITAAFNNAPELSSFFNYLKRKYHIDTVIETGTFKGDTTALFGRLFDRVYTIEISEPMYLTAKETLKPYENIQCYLGSSEKILKEILPSMQGSTILFYLDAHWEDHWPLLEELEEISKTHRDHCIIVIDDIKVPGKKNIPYDKYGEHECSYEYIKTQLDKVFSDYSFHYVLPKERSSRAKFVAICKNL